MTAFMKANIPPTPNAVLVQSISENATDKNVKDFFSFCGTINEFEMIKRDSSQEAFILFDKVSAANTARLLSNAIIVDRAVTVKSYFEVHDTDPAAAVEADEKKALEEKSTDHKPYTRVIAELLAAGYQLTSQVVQRGVQIDDKYSVTKTLSAFLMTAQAKAQALDEKYKVTHLLRDIDSKYHVSENANAILAKGLEVGQQVSQRALNTTAGQKVKETFDVAKEKTLEVASETRQIVDEQRAARGSSVPAAPAAAVPAPESSTTAAPQ